MMKDLTQFDLHGYLAPFVPSAPHQVQRNCCLTLCNFSIPEELEFQYSRVNQLLLKILEPARQDESIQRIAVHLCNALVCQVDNHHKEAVGKMGFVKVTSRKTFPFSRHMLKLRKIMFDRLP